MRLVTWILYKIYEFCWPKQSLFGLKAESRVTILANIICYIYVFTTWYQILKNCSQIQVTYLTSNYAVHIYKHYLYKSSKENCQTLCHYSFNVC